jgi:hypothetical protein
MAMGPRSTPHQVPSRFRWNTLIAVVPGSRLGQHFKRLRVQHNNGPVFETNPIAGRPYPQLFVDAFPGHADHLADFLLRDCDSPAFWLELVFLGQANKRAGEPARQILKNDLFQLAAGPPQARAKEFDEFHRQRRLASYKGKKFAPIQDKDLAIGVCRSVGRSRQPVEQRNFPESLTCTDEIEDGAAAVGGGNAHLHRAAHHRKQAGSGISLGKERRTPLEHGMSGVAGKLVKGLRFKIAKNRMLAQER